MLHWWSDQDLQTLKELYPKATKQEILKALNTNPNVPKSWDSIQKQASRLGLKREDFPRGRKKKKKKTYVGIRQLKDYLENTDLTIDEIAEKLRTDPDIVRRYIQRYGL